MDPEEIYIADVVFVPLEDGDRTEALVATGKKIIAVDLNPLSRTAQMANITIVNNIIRFLPAIIEKAKELSTHTVKELTVLLSRYNNKAVLN